jgi:hypothetical protein
MPEAMPIRDAAGHLLPMPLSMAWVNGLRVTVHSDRISLLPSRWPEFGGAWVQLSSWLLVSFGVVFFSVLACAKWGTNAPILSAITANPIVPIGIICLTALLLVLFWLAWAVSGAMRQAQAPPLVVRCRPSGQIEFPRWSLTLAPESFVGFEIIRGVISDDDDSRRWRWRVEQLAAIYIDGKGRPIRRFVCATRPGFKRATITWMETLLAARVVLTDIAHETVVDSLWRAEPVESMLFAEMAVNHELAAIDGRVFRPMACAACGYPVDDLVSAERCP